MKKLRILVAAFLASIAIHGQGQVQFDNFTIPNALVTYPDGTGVGPDWRIQLFLPNGTRLGIPQPFESSFPGQFFAGVITVPGMAPGTMTSFQVAVWHGESFDAALVRGIVMSDVTTLGGDTLLPPNVFFPAITVPEPSVLALGLLGCFTILCIRLKRREGNLKA